MSLNKRLDKVIPFKGLQETILNVPTIVCFDGSYLANICYRGRLRPDYKEIISFFHQNTDLLSVDYFALLNPRVEQLEFQLISDLTLRKGIMKSHLSYLNRLGYKTHGRYPEITEMGLIKNDLPTEISTYILSKYLDKSLAVKQIILFAGDLSYGFLLKKLCGYKVPVSLITYPDSRIMTSEIYHLPKKVFSFKDFCLAINALQ